MKKYIISAFVLSTLSLNSCAELQQVVDKIPTGVTDTAVSSLDMGNALKQALDLGVTDGVNLLTQKDGFLKNELVKVLLPDELKKVDEALRKIGLSKLSDEGLKLLNRAAEDAVVEAGPIFKDAITGMSFNDAKSIVLGDKDAATNYLKSKTSSELFSKFQPKVEASLGKVGADKVWTDMLNKYNAIPFVKKVDTDLNKYVTEQAMSGLFKMVEDKEANIRGNSANRTTDLLKKVFALQD